MFKIREASFMIYNLNLVPFDHKFFFPGVLNWIKMADIVGEKPNFPILSHANLFFERKKIFTLNKRNWAKSLIIKLVILFLSSPLLISGH